MSDEDGDSSTGGSSNDSDEELKLGKHGIHAYDAVDPFDDGEWIWRKNTVAGAHEVSVENLKKQRASAPTKKDVSQVQDPSGSNPITKDPPADDQASFTMSDNDEDGGGGNFDSQTGPDWELLRYTRQRNFKGAYALLSKEDYKPTTLVKDAKSCTAAHYAAKTSNGEATLTLIVEYVGTSCLTRGDYHLMTPLHYAAACYPSVKQFLDKLNNCERKIIRKAETGDTVAHLAAANVHSRGTKCIIEIVDKVGPECLQWQNSRKQTVLHLVAENGSAEALKDLVERAKNDQRPKNKDQRPNECLTLCDEEGNTYFHYAVRNPFEGSKMIEAAISMPEGTPNPRLDHENHKKQTVLQCAVISEWCDDSMTKQLIKEASPKCREASSKCRNASPEYREACSEYREACPKCREASHKCLTHRDKFGNNALMYAVKNGKHAAAIELLHSTDEDSWLAVNNERQTALHLAFGDSKLTQHLKDDHLEMYNRLINCGTPDGLGRSYLFYACMGWNFQPVLDHLKAKRNETRREENEPVLLRSIDIDGNTLLHALFLGSGANPSNEGDKTVSKGSDANTSNEGDKSVSKGSDANPSNEGDKTVSKGSDANSSNEIARISDFFRVFDELLKWAVDPQKENDLGQNYLHASLLPEETLIFILNQLVDDGNPNMNEFKKEFKKALTTSNGFHAIHSFASRYTLKTVLKPLEKQTEKPDHPESLEKQTVKPNLVEPLAKLTGIPQPNLLRLAVSKGPLKGATCLHLAYETGHKENIAFLTEEGLELAAETYAGLTCVDFAHNVGKIDAIETKFSEANTDNESKLEVLCLMDPPHRSLKLPHRTQARQLLAGTLDIPQGNKVLQGAKRAPRNPSHPERKSSTMRAQILEKAMDLDSPAILRSGLRLKLVNRKSEAYYFINLQSKQDYKSSRPHCAYRHKHRHKHEKEATLTSSESNSLSHKKFLDFLKLGTFHESSEMLIVDAAFFLKKTELLPDLIVTRQFELIPVCLSLLVQLRPKIAEKSGHEQDALRELRGRVVGIAVTALDELFASANEEENVDLLMKYIRGKIKYKWDDKFNPGPKFPCRSEDHGGVKFFTIYQLAKKVDSEDLFATDCFHHLIGKKWTEKSIKFYLSAELKFWFHLVAFILFLVFYAWYLIDFRTTFQSYAPDAFMAAYLLSFTAQEAHQMWLGKITKNFYWEKDTVQCPVYCQDGLNLFDCAAIIIMWIGLLWKWAIFSSLGAHPTTYACQMILSTSFLLLGFRSVSFLSYFERIGPVISMMRSLLLKDLLPFAAIILVIFYSSGVFFFNLLFPVVTSSEDSDSGYGWRVFLQVFTLPLDLFLAEPPGYDKVDIDAGLNQTIGSVAHADGYDWFSKLLIFIFLILVNIVMVNLLIALFSLRVNTMVSKARCIWRRKYFHLMKEFVTASPLPPPLSFVFYIISLFTRVGKVESAETNLWWKSSGQSYPPEYIKYLKFQAINLRRVRPRLLRELEQNRTDMDALKAFTGNSLSIMQRELEEALQKQEENLRKLEERQEALRPSLQPSGSHSGDDRSRAGALPEVKCSHCSEANSQLQQKVGQLEEKMDTMARMLRELPSILRSAK